MIRLWGLQGRCNAAMCNFPLDLAFGSGSATVATPITLQTVTTNNLSFFKEFMLVRMKAKSELYILFVYFFTQLKCIIVPYIGLIFLLESSIRTSFTVWILLDRCAIKILVFSLMTLVVQQWYKIHTLKPPGAIILKFYIFSTHNFSKLLTCFGIFWSYSGSYWTSINHTYKKHGLLNKLKFVHKTFVDVLRFVCISASYGAVLHYYKRFL
jgi:hypothetical protein